MRCYLAAAFFLFCTVVAASGGFPRGTAFNATAPSGPAILWSTTAALTPTTVAGAGGTTFVSKWTQGTASVFNAAPGANTNIQVTFKASASILTIADAWIGAAQTLAAQCAGTTRLWNFAPSPTHLVTVSTAIPANTSQSFTVPFTWPGAPLIISYDVANTKFGAQLTLNVSPNYSPVSQIANFNGWLLTGVSQSSTACKNASYTQKPNQIMGIIQITSQP